MDCRSGHLNTVCSDCGGLVALAYVVMLWKTDSDMCLARGDIVEEARAGADQQGLDTQTQWREDR